MLVANFGTSSISGDIRDIDFFDAYTVTPNGDVVSLVDDPSSDYVLIFGATPIQQNGQFVGNNITLTPPDGKYRDYQWIMGRALLHGQ